jgi:hypothetical protein
MTVRDDLIAARALIDTPEKWVRGHYERQGCYCALGAARKALYGTTDWRPGEDWRGDDNHVTTALRRELSEEWHGSVDDFNDDPSTTHADVLALFDRAIAAQPQP